jgi:hypothetical protein
MPEWLMELLLAVIGSTAITGGIGWWFKTIREDRIARELSYVTQIKELQQEVKKEQQENKEHLQERIRYETVRGDSTDQTNKLLVEAMALLRQLASTMKEPR